ncbi:MAG: alpha/beta hydrolase [Gammaproteobacteria bacterium]
MHWTSSHGHGQAAQRRGRSCCARRLLGPLLAALAMACGAAENAAPHHPRLHLECHGRGSPAVILDAGLGGSSLEWVYVVERLRKLTRVCTYDRAGYGQSEMGPAPRTSSRIANELYLLLEDSDVPPPYVLAGHSFGGYNMQLFARRYPYLSAGLVLVDASHPDQVDRFLAPPLGLLTAPSSRYGIVRFSEPPPPHELLPEPVRRAIRKRAGRWKTRRTLGNELLGFRDSALELKAAPPLGTLPLVVVTRGIPRGPIDAKRPLIEQLWLELQSELAAGSTASAHLVARRAGHNVHVEQPAVVAYGIALLVERYRRQRGVGGSAFVRGIAARFPLEDATWLHDSLSLHPADEPAHIARTPAAVAGPVLGDGAP